MGGRWGKAGSRFQGTRKGAKSGSWTASRLFASRHCLLLTADCLLHLRRAGWSGLFAGMAALDKMSPPIEKEETSNFKK